MAILELARKISKKGDQYLQKHGIKDFHKKASELLADSDLAAAYDFQELVELTFKAKHSQHYKNLEFSDLPLTIAQGEHCFIDVYFWRRRPTVIHNHHFAGAFMCLFGNNVDMEFTFKKEKKLGRFHDLGKLEIKQTRQLRPGDIAEIAFMDKFIHQNHHQDELTANLCFRTREESKRSLSNYFYSGFRYEKNPELLGRVNRLLRFIDLGAFDHKKLPISHDEAINFLIQTYGTPSNNPRLLKVKSELDKRVKNDLDLDLSRLIKEHDQMLEKIENDYE